MAVAENRTLNFNLEAVKVWRVWFYSGLWDIPYGGNALILARLRERNRLTAVTSRTLVNNFLTRGKGWWIFSQSSIHCHPAPGEFTRKQSSLPLRTSIRVIRFLERFQNFRGKFIAFFFQLLLLSFFILYALPYDSRIRLIIPGIFLNS